MFKRYCGYIYDDLISYEKMEERIIKIVDANRDSIYKDKEHVGKNS